MHNASKATLADVVRHYESGGIERDSRSPMFMPVELSDGERADLVAFLESLTGEEKGAPVR
jgi:cytochrome c peroxidase